MERIHSMQSSTAELITGIIQTETKLNTQTVEEGDREKNANLHFMH